jgi:competence protein ComEA
MLKQIFTTLCCVLSLSAQALEVNTANEAELDSVRGLGPSSTARILLAREQGPFKDWADFMQRVKGIKPATASKLSATGLTVNQLPFAAPDSGTEVR